MKMAIVIAMTFASISSANALVLDVTDQTLFECSHVGGRLSKVRVQAQIFRNVHQSGDAYFRPEIVAISNHPEFSRGSMNWFFWDRRGLNKEYPTDNAVAVDRVDSR